MQISEKPNLAKQFCAYEVRNFKWWKAQYPKMLLSSGTGQLPLLGHGGGQAELVDADQYSSKELVTKYHALWCLLPLGKNSIRRMFFRRTDVIMTCLFTKKGGFKKG